MTTQYDASYQPVGDGQGMGLSSGLYSWAGKPPANSVPVSTVITIKDFCYSDWYTDGAYWRPRGGRVVICNADLTAYTTTSTTLAVIPISTADLPVLPLNDLMKIPKGRFISYFTAIRNSPVTGLPVIWAQWAPPSNATFCRASFTASTPAPFLLVSGDAEYFDGSQYRSAAWGGAAYYNGTASSPAYNAIPSTPVQPIISANTGGAGETLQLREFILEFYA